MPVQVLPISEYMPDLPDQPGGGSSLIKNVYPRTVLSYGAVGSQQTLYNALNSRCQGSVALRDSNANVHIFAADANDLYSLSGGAWTVVSSSPGTYGIDPNDQWQFAYFNGDLIATDFADPLQRLALVGGTNFASIPNSPRGRYIAVIKNAFVVLGNTFDSTNGNVPQRLQWSAAGDATNWPDPGTTAAAQVQSGAVNLFGLGGNVQGFAPDLVSADSLVFQETIVRRLMYVGPPDVFSVLPLESAQGTPAPYSIVTHGGIAYYLGQDGFYACDGGASKAIGVNKIDKTVFNDIDLGQINRVIGAVDPLNRLIIWAYPGAGNPGNPNRLLMYNWELDRFSLTEMTCETIVRSLSPGYTLDELYTILGYTVDTVPAPFDSPIWTGGRLNLALFGGDRASRSHKFNVLTGTPLQAFVETQEMNPTPGRHVFVRNTKPLVDGTDTVSYVSVGGRHRVNEPVSYTSPSKINSLGDCPLRKSGEYIRAQITIDAGTTSWTNISGVEIDWVPQGTR